MLKYFILVACISRAFYFSMFIKERRKNFENFHDFEKRNPFQIPLIHKTLLNIQNFTELHKTNIHLNWNVFFWKLTRIGNFIWVLGSWLCIFIYQFWFFSKIVESLNFHIKMTTFWQKYFSCRSCSKKLWASKCMSRSGYPI